MSTSSGLPLKHLFELPDGIIYLDGNSLGPLPKGAVERTRNVMTKEWAQQLIRAWNTAGWMSLPSSVGDRIAQIVGAPEKSIVTGDTLSIKVYQALAAALNLNPDRSVVLSDTGNFPSDLYMARGLISTMAGNRELKLVEPHEIAGAIERDVAVVMLTHVDYRTGRMHDLNEITARAHDAGAVMIWDLAHSAGAVPIDLNASGTEFAVGCTYKYLNGGPGAPAFIYMRPDIVSQARPALAGWLGHDDPFAMELDYRPAGDIERMRVGTPAIIQLAILDEALRIWESVDMREVRRASITLTELFIKEVELRCPQLRLVSPRKYAERGSQVSFAFAEGYAAMQALIERGVIGDFRAPDIMRFGFTPLYLDENDVIGAAEVLEKVLAGELWRDSRYRARTRVT
jgi:kynureninase